MGHILKGVMEKELDVVHETERKSERKMDKNLVAGRILGGHIAGTAFWKLVCDR